MSAKPKNATRIIRSGRGHRYELDGEKTPGVTTIIKGAVPMPALVGWAGRTVAEYVLERITARKTNSGEEHYLADELIADLLAYNETRGRFREKLPNAGFSRVGLTKVLSSVMYADRDAAANRGTEVHGIAAKIAQGEEVEVPEELAGHVDAYIAFLDDWRPTDAIVEGVVVSRKWRYMGRFDSILTLPVITLRDGSAWGGRTLLDIKTSRSGPYGEDALQLCGYRYAETMLTDEGEVPIPPVDSVGIVHVRADGYDVYPFVADERTFRIFLYCQQVAAALDRDDGLVGASKLDAVAPPVLEDTTP